MSVESIAAFDLGTTTGWAFLHPDGRGYSGIVGFKAGRFEGGGMRYLRFRRWIADFLFDNKPTAVYFEEVRRHMGVDAAHVYGGLLGQLTAECELTFVPYQGVPVGTIKRHATGKGNASKEAMIAAMVAKGYRPADDNEADALAIMHWAIDTAGGAR